MHGNWIYIHLVLFYIAADTCYFGHAFHTREGKTNLEILNRTQLLRIPATCRISVCIVPFKGVPENLAKSSRIGPPGRFHSIRKRTARKRAELLKEEIGRAHAGTPVTWPTRRPTSAGTQKGTEHNSMHECTC